ncbi:MAG: VWA domain-containing protein [Pyrinomonadaceae bacterium]
MSRLRHASVIILIIVFVVFVASLTTGAQSGRRKGPLVKTSSNTNSRTKPAATTEQPELANPSSPPKATSSPPKVPSAAAKDQNEIDANEVVRVSSQLVPVPATVLDSRGFAVTNLKLEDFELQVDGQPKPISELSRTETPVRMVMLFDNSGSLTESREFEKRAAMRFFRSVMRPVDQAAIYSVSTDVILEQPLTADVMTLERTIEGFGKPEGSTALFDAIAEGAAYLIPYRGRRVIVIVSDGKENTSRLDFETTMNRIVTEDCQIYVVQTGLYENANVRDLAAERRMQQFSSQTGGAVYIPKSVEELDAAFGQIAADLAQQYVLSYYPADDKRDGQYHTMTVRVTTRANARVRARKVFVVKPRQKA